MSDHVEWHRTAHHGFLNIVDAHTTACLRKTSGKRGGDGLRPERGQPLLHFLYRTWASRKAHVKLVVLEVEVVETCESMKIRQDFSPAITLTALIRTTFSGLMYRTMSGTAPPEPVACNALENFVEVDAREDNWASVGDGQQHSAVDLAHGVLVESQGVKAVDWSKAYPF